MPGLCIRAMHTAIAMEKMEAVNTTKVFRRKNSTHKVFRRKNSTHCFLG
jgi:hypothetical protein